MNVSELFIKRPVTTTLIMLGIIVFGMMAYRTLPVSDLPTVDFPTIQVQASLPGASPETMAADGRDAAREAVRDDCRRRQDQLDQPAWAARTSRCSSTSIRNIDAAAQDVQTMIARTTRPLPPDMPAPPSYQKVEPGRSADHLPRPAIGDAAAVDGRRVRAETIAQRMSMVDGVAQVDVFGAQKFAVRIDLDPRELASRAHRHRRGRRRRSPTRTRAGRRARSTGRQDVRRADERPADQRRRVTGR